MCRCIFYWIYRPFDLIHFHVTFYYIDHYAILVHIYLLSDFISGTNWFPVKPHESPSPLSSLPFHFAYPTINRFSKIRKYDFWVLSRETTFPFDGTSSMRVSFPANCRRQVKPNSLDALFDEHGCMEGVLAHKRGKRTMKTGKGGDTIGRMNLEKDILSLCRRSEFYRFICVIQILCII